MRVQFPACKESKRVEVDRTYFLDSEGIADISEYALEWLYSEENKTVDFIDLESSKQQKPKKEVSKEIELMTKEIDVNEEIELKSESKDYDFNNMSYEALSQLAEELELDKREWRRMDETKLREYLVSKTQ